MTSLLPPDHAARIERALLSLDGLSVGDAFGVSVHFLGEPGEPRNLPRPPWYYTDDTTLAKGIVEVLQRHGRIDQDDLAQVLARRHAAEPNRGYGPITKKILKAIDRGVPWRIAAVREAERRPGWMERLEVWLGLRSAPTAGPTSLAIPGLGSRGNGASMRVAPVGAYCADDVGAVVREAAASAAVTHAHPDGIAGAVAVAVAAAWAWRNRDVPRQFVPELLLDHVIEHTPDSPTRSRIVHARTLPADTTVFAAARQLGTGQPIIAVETVPFCLWVAARHLREYEEAIWEVAAAGGDRDTMCAIVGGIVVMGADREAIPAEWLASREPLDL